MEEASDHVSSRRSVRITLAFPEVPWRFWFFKNIYLFGCTGPYLWHVGSLLQYVGSFFFFKLQHAESLVAACGRF